MKLKTIIFATISLCGPMLPPALAQETLRIGTEGTYRPWTMADANGRVTGFDADMAALVCQKLKAQCSFVVQNFDSLIPSLAAGRFDMIMTSLSISEERRRQIDFSVSYAEMPNSFVVPKASPLAGIKDKQALLKALSGKKIGVLNAATHALYIEKNIPGADLKTYDTLDQMQMDLTAGRLDAGFSDVLAWNAYLARPENRDFGYVDVVIANAEDPSTLGEGIGIGLPKGRARLKEEVNKAICALEADGSVRNISEKWFDGADVAVQCR